MSSYILNYDLFLVHFCVFCKKAGPTSFFSVWIFSCPSIMFCKDLSSLAPPVNYLDTLLDNNLIVNVRVYGWTLSYILFIYKSILNVYPNHFILITAAMSKNLMWVLHICSFSKLCWLFWVPCISIWILGSSGQFLQKSWYWGSDYVQSTDMLWQYIQVNNIMSSNP